MTMTQIAPVFVQTYKGTAKARLAFARMMGFPRETKPGAPAWARWRHTGPLHWFNNTPPQAGQYEERMLYLEHSGMPCSDTRWGWCDEINVNINHTGWFTERDCASDKIRGVVFYLPHGRMVAGASMGEGMASMVDVTTIFHADDDGSEEDACARHADSLAEGWAEREIEERDKEEQERKDQAQEIISKMPRERVIELLENISIACYDEESTGELRECLWLDVEEESNYTIDDAHSWGNE